MTCIKTTVLLGWKRFRYSGSGLGRTFERSIEIYGNEELARRGCAAARMLYCMVAFELHLVSPTKTSQEPSSFEARLRLETMEERRKEHQQKAKSVEEYYSRHTNSKTQLRNLDALRATKDYREERDTFAFIDLTSRNKQHIHF
jgi:hypothetical protein